jgi:hypothetical protein
VYYQLQPVSEADLLLMRRIEGFAHGISGEYINFYTGNGPIRAWPIRRRRGALRDAACDQTGGMIVSVVPLENLKRLSD